MDNTLLARHGRGTSNPASSSFGAYAGCFTPAKMGKCGCLNKCLNRASLARVFGRDRPPYQLRVNKVRLTSIRGNISKTRALIVFIDAGNWAASSIHTFSAPLQWPQLPAENNTRLVGRANNRESFFSRGHKTCSHVLCHANSCTACSIL